MSSTASLHRIRRRRALRVRARIQGTAARPRLAVFRSNRATSAQLIDDVAARTLLSASTRELKKSKEKAKGKVSAAHELGAFIAAEAKKAGISKVLFDRRSYRYHGRVKAVAEGARAGGLEV